MNKSIMELIRFFILRSVVIKRRGNTVVYFNFIIGISLLLSLSHYRRECIQSICMLLAAAACCLLERSEAGPPPPVPSPPLREAPGIVGMR